MSLPQPRADGRVAITLGEYRSMTDNRQRPRRGRLPGWLRPGIAGLAAVALAAAPACGDDGADGAGTEPTTTEAPPETTSTTAPPTPEEEAEAVYLEFVEVLDRLTTQDPDPDDPELGRLASDPLLSDVRDSLTTLASENQVWEVGDRSTHEVDGASVTSEGDVELNACVVEDDVLVDRDDGTVVERPQLATRELSVTVERADDSWVVSSIATINVMEGETSCI